jgi:hypothetical protein
MPAALGPRFALEAGFLILLAVVVGLADLSPALIILVMAIGWLLVAVIEYIAWRQSPRLVTASRYGEAVEEVPPPPIAEEEAVEETAPPRAPEPAPAPAPPPEEETVVAPAAEAAEPAEERKTEAAPLAFNEPERQVRHRLEPLQPRPRRRWILFGPYERGDQAEGSSEGSSEEES